MANSHKLVAAADAHAPAGHHASHENGGSDEIDATGLTGVGATTTVANDTIWAAKGDIVAATGNDASAVLTVGANDTILMADSSVSNGLKWVASASPSAVGTAAATGTADTFTRGDHVHAHEAAHIAHDTLWDTAGDLVVGSGADTAAKLAIGAVGSRLARVNGAVAWDSGTSNPTAAAGDRYWRSDLGLDIVYDGTRWLCTCPHKLQIDPSAGSLPLAASNTIQRMGFPHPGQFGIYVQNLFTTFNVVGGTALSASHKWVGVAGDDTSSTSLGTITIDSGSSSVWRLISSTPNVVGASSLFEYLVTWTKTGTPGNMYAHTSIMYRLIVT